MSNLRIQFTDIKTRLVAQASAAFAHIGTAYDTDYIEQLKKAQEAVFLTSQKSARIDDGRGGFTGNNRQRFRVEILIRVTVPRSVTGAVGNREPVLSAKVDTLIAAMRGWQAPGADHPFILDSSRDGDPTESILWAELTFATTVTYTETFP